MTDLPADLHAYAEYLPRLRERDAMVLRYRYGDDLAAVKCHTLGECAARFKITRERIRQLEARGIRALERCREMAVLNELRRDMPKTDDRRTCRTCAHFAHWHWRISDRQAERNLDLPLRDIIEAEDASMYGHCRRLPPTGCKQPLYAGNVCGEWQAMRCDDARPIEALDWSVRARSIFQRQGIVTVGQLANTPAREVLNWRNLGTKTMLEIRQRLREAGIEWDVDHRPHGAKAQRGEG
jgi:hypothetical protein